MQIIFDRKAKRKSFDNQWTDPLGVDSAKAEKARTIEIPADKANLPIYRALATLGPRGLLGHKCWAITDKNNLIHGVISDIIPPNYIVLRNKGVARMNDVVSIGG